MLKKSISLLSALAMSGTLLAQTQTPPPAVGKTAEVKGLVTVSMGTNVTTVTGIIPVVNGSRFVTASTGFATIRFEDGCDVKLEPNQAYTVESDRPCAARVASVQALPGAAGNVFAGADLLRPLMGVGLFVAGASGLYNLAGNGGSTPAGGGGATPGGPDGGGGGIPNPPPSGQ